MTKQQSELGLMQDAIRKLQSQNEIADQIHRYCFFFDSSDLQGLKGLFTIDAIVDYGPEMGPISGIENIMNSISGGLRNTFAATSHHISNIIIEFIGAEEAHASSYVYAWHKYLKKPEIGYLWGQYSHVFRYEAGTWKISHLKLNAVAIQDFHRSNMHPVNRLTLEQSTNV